MIYMEDYVDIATTVDQLISILSTKVPRDAAIEQAEGYRSPDVEVWYDKDTNTVILK